MAVKKKRAGKRSGKPALRKISYKPVPSLEELLRQVTPENRHPEIDWGPPVGAEEW
jgi:antitoxin component of MazEF toxin-antitoxin module